MRINRNYIKFFTILFLVVFLYSFTNQRNEKRYLVAGIAIEYTDDEAVYITQEMVNKLLIQNKENVTNMAKEKLVLNSLERVLNSNKMIEDAHVYLTIKKQLKVKIKQKTPIARVSGEESFYIDTKGEAMPLSPVFSARVPLITGTVKKERTADVHTLAMYVYNDEFLKKNVIGIHQQGKRFDIRFRTEDFIVKLGDAEHLDTKFNNLKAFYQKALKDNTLGKYSMVNLEFKNQIVCTKRKTYGE